MKLIIVVCTLLALVSAVWVPKALEDINKDRQACFVETKLSDHGIQMVKEGKYPDDPGCYFHCVGLKTGMWDDINGFNTDISYQIIYAGGYDVGKESVTKCNTADKKNDDTCLWVASVAKCMWDNNYVKKRDQQFM